MESSPRLVEGDAPTLLDLRNRDPYPLYARLREAGPVTWDAGLGAWLVTGHDACVEVERDEEVFGQATAGLTGSVEITGARSVLTLEGEAHAKLHKFLARSLAPREIEPYRETIIRPLIEGFLDEFCAEGTVDVASRFAMTVPIATVARVLGLEHDRAALARSRTWMDAVLAWRHSYGMDPEIVEQARVAARASVADVMPTVRARREEPRDDLISALWAVGPEILDDWGEDDVLDQCRVLFEAGSDTTAHLICTATALLAFDPDLEARVRGEDGALTYLIEEALRLWTVVHMRARVAHRDVELEGVQIRAGERVHPVNAAANRDPARYERPDQLELGRPGFASHLAFNVGARHCVGAALARMEASEAIAALLRRVPRVQLDPDREPPIYYGFVSRSFRPLWLQLAP